MGQAKQTHQFHPPPPPPPSEDILSRAKWHSALHSFPLCSCGEFHLLGVPVGCAPLHPTYLNQIGLLSLSCAPDGVVTLEDSGNGQPFSFAGSIVLDRTETFGIFSFYSKYSYLSLSSKCMDQSARLIQPKKHEQTRMFTPPLLISNYPLGQYIIITTPTRAIKPPIRSNLSGAILSIFHPQRIERTMNIPP